MKHNATSENTVHSPQQATECLRQSPTSPPQEAGISDPHYGNKSPLRRFSSLLVLVALVFFVLLISFTIAGVIVYVLIQNGQISPMGNRNLIGVLLFLLLVSLGIGTILAAISGTFFLRPLRRLNNATKQIATGNFDVHLEASGPHEMQRLTNSFNEMAEELGRTETLQSDFVSNVSHEFKTPVASIRGFAKLLKRDTLTKAQRDEYLDVILLESERLTQLSGNVLLLSNLDNTAHLPDATAFSLDEQLRQSILLFQTQMDIKQLRAEVELEPITIHGNEELLKQVWLNLLGNAIKFTPEKGTIYIKATPFEDAAIVTVRDTGIGMSEEVKIRLYDKFYQGDTSHATQGNGLGMALVQRILTLNGGKITVHSTEGEGTTFTVVLPKVL